MKTCKDCPIWPRQSKIEQLDHCAGYAIAAVAGLHYKMCTMGKLLLACHKQRDRARQLDKDIKTQWKIIKQLHEEIDILRRNQMNNSHGFGPDDSPGSNIKKTGNYIQTANRKDQE